MKLDTNTVSYIQTVVKTAKLVGIDNIIIEPNCVRAIDDNNTVVLFQNENVPEMPFGSIGMNRLDVFAARYEIAKAQDKFTIDVETNDEKTFARSIIMKAKGIKIDYRCANPAAIKAPRQINDTMKWRVRLTGEAVSLLQRGQSAMAADRVSIISNESVFFELTDVNNDVFKQEIASEVESLTADTSMKFVHRYPVKTLISLFKQNPDGYFDIGAKGILAFSLNNLKIFVLPQV